MRQQHQFDRQFARQSRRRQGRRKNQQDHQQGRRLGRSMAMVVAGVSVFAVGATIGLSGYRPSLDAVRSSMSAGAPQAGAAADRAKAGNGTQARPGKAEGEDRVQAPAVMQADDAKRGMVYDGLKVAKTGTCLGQFEATTVNGHKVCSHGPDAPMPGFNPKKPVQPIVATKRAPVTGAGSAQPGEAALAAESTPGASQPGAAPAAETTVPCDGDGTSGNRVQVLYVHGGTNRYAEFLDSFRTWSAGIDRIYSASAKQTGGDRHVRFVTEKVGGACRPTITDVGIADGALGDFGSSINAIQAAGFNRKDRKYVMWTDAGVFCGIGGFAGDDRKSDSNRSNFGPSYGRSDNGCWSASVAAHELGHNLGAVADSAPNSSKGGHCVDEYDLMCYSDEPFRPQMQIKCADRAGDEILDCNHDDYYSTAPKGGSYLATHFNVADNIFLIKGGGGGGGTDTEAPTVPADLKAGKPAATSVALTWTASKDNTAVTGYDVLANGTKLGSTAKPAFTAEGLTPETKYSFTVVAKDEAGNASKASAPLAVTTPKGGGGGGGTGLTVGSTGTLTNSLTGRSADVVRVSKADGAPVIQYPTHGGTNQQWTVQDGGNGLVMLAVKSSGKCLTVTGGSKANGTAIVQQPCTKAAGQLWKATEKGTGYVLTSADSGMELGLGSTRVDGWRVLAQRTAADRKSHVWAFAPVS
jgi:hypothetical protein